MLRLRDAVTPPEPRTPPLLHQDAVTFALDESVMWITRTTIHRVISFGSHVRFSVTWRGTMDRRIFRNIAAAERARHRMRRTGRTMSGQRLWTEAEDQIVRDHHPDYEAIVRITGRTYYAVQHRAQKLGLTTKRRDWRTTGISQLRRLYPEAPHDVLLTAFPGYTIVQIRQAANYRRIYRKRKPYKATGYHAIDQIRARAFELAYSMADVDALSGARYYFTKAGWHNFFHHRAVARAIEALDGRITAIWND